MRRVIAPLLLAAAGMLLGGTLVAEDGVTRTSRPVRLLATWEETVKNPDGSEYPRRVELVFDYGTGFARESYYGPDGKRYGARDIKQSLPAPTPEEIAEAQNVIRRDPDLGRIVQRRPVVFDGGFLLEEGRGRPCGPGHRCLQIQLLSADRSGLVRWTVVDLVALKVVYPVFVPRGVASGVTP